jgi:ATP-binding cassette subfamily B protein
VRLAVLDEPFRGLDAEQRHALLGVAREAWKDATLFFISHDIAETESFNRVVLIENGRVAEDGDPRKLLADRSSRLYAFRQAERSVREGLWSDPGWRHLRLQEGELIEP